jgi:hypothetical protein
MFSETLASTDESTRRQNPEEHHHPQHTAMKTTNLAKNEVCSVQLGSSE